VAVALRRGGRARVVAGVVVIAAMLAAPSVSHAGLLSTSDQARLCDPVSSQAFSAWGDQANYMLTPGGSFDGGAAWKLVGPARIVAGNEPFFVHSPSDTHSLLLPSGSSAVTPTMCFAPGDWHLRLFAVNTGSQSSMLKVTVIVHSLPGILSVLDGGTIRSSQAWQPSPRLQLLLSNVTCLLGTNAVSFAFAPIGSGAAWQIDDVLLDPFKST
jgi:hypothetical protein